MQRPSSVSLINKCIIFPHIGHIKPHFAVWGYDIFAQVLQRYPHKKSLFMVSNKVWGKRSQHLLIPWSDLLGQL